MDGGWVGQPHQSHDRVVRHGVTEQELTDFIGITYRVLLTRRLRGRHVYFMDASTRDFLMSRIERTVRQHALAAEEPADYAS